MKSVRSKYGSVKTVVSGRVFDSKREAEVARDLLLMERAGKIENLGFQVKYELIPPQPKFKERAVTYFADMVYTDKATGEEVVIDVKSSATRKLAVYILKRKLMAFIHGISVLEVV